MNAKAVEIGMANTSFINPSGLCSCGSYSSSTTYDLARMGVAALSNNILAKIWRAKNHIIKVKGKSIAITSSVQSSLLENYYPIIGGKTGAGDGYFTLVVVTKIAGVFVVGAIAKATSTDGRFVAMKQLFDVANVAIHGGAPVGTVSAADYACAIGIDSLGGQISVLYGQGENTPTPPMSTTKIMTAITFLDYVNLSDTCTRIKAVDVEGTSGTSGSFFHIGDSVSYKDLMYSALLPSSNQAANALARIAGRVILRGKSARCIV